MVERIKTWYKRDWYAVPWFNEEITVGKIRDDDVHLKIEPTSSQFFKYEGHIRGTLVDLLRESKDIGGILVGGLESSHDINGTLVGNLKESRKIEGKVYLKMLVKKAIDGTVIKEIDRKIVAVGVIVNGVKIERRVTGRSESVHDSLDRINDILDI